MPHESSHEPPPLPDAPHRVVPVDEVFEHYRIFRRPDGSLWELGHGAMGVTYKAIDTNLDKPVALKIINSQSFSKESARKRFRREARSAASLHHRHVASVFHLGEGGGNFFYAMEFIDGETIDALVKREGPLPWRAAFGIALQVTRALMAAHAKGLVHRDIKPSNIMLADEVDERGVVKLIDFGLAKSAVEEEGSHVITNVSGFLGTPLYASPEQCEEIPADIRSDIYSLGITLWYMLTGQPTFLGTLGKVFHQQMYSEPPWHRLPDDLPSGVHTVLKRMLAKDREQRPQTPADLRTGIEECLERPGIRTDTGRPAEPPPMPAAAAASKPATVGPPPMGTARPGTATPAGAASAPAAGSAGSAGSGAGQPTGKSSFVLSPQPARPAGDVSGGGEETLDENTVPPLPRRREPSEWQQKKKLLVATVVVGVVTLVALFGDKSDSSDAARKGRSRAAKAEAAAKVQEKTAETKAQKAQSMTARIVEAAKRHAAAQRARAGEAAAGAAADAGASARAALPDGEGGEDDEVQQEIAALLQSVGIGSGNPAELSAKFKFVSREVIASIVEGAREMPDPVQKAKLLGAGAILYAKLGDAAKSQETFALAMETASGIPDEAKRVATLKALEAEKAKTEEKASTEKAEAPVPPPLPPLPPLAPTLSATPGSAPVAPTAPPKP